jgi:hypothetical protein
MNKLTLMHPEIMDLCYDHTMHRVQIWNVVISGRPGAVDSFAR